MRGHKLRVNLYADVYACEVGGYYFKHYMHLEFIHI